MTIGKKISLACSALVALTVILGTVSIATGSRIKSAVNLLVVDSLPATVSIGRLDSLVKEQRAFALRHMLMETPEQKKQAESDMAAGVNKFQTEMSAYEKTIATPRERELFEKMTRSFEQFSRVWAKIQSISRESKQKEAVGLWMAEGLPAAEVASKVAAEMIELNKANSDASCAAAAAASVAGQFWAAAVLGLAVVSGGLLAFFIVRGINSALTLAVAELGEGAQQVSVAASQVSGSSQSLAQGASEQAASLEETSASSEEMSSMTRRNAENSHQAAAFMNTMGTRVADANATVAEMMTSMYQIDEASGKISKIIRLIDEIAFQTNILALNAAVEAARAGAAGMGFSVVAEEVRNLAQRSAQAAKDTASLVEDSILKSAEGTTKLAQVASSVRAITEGVGKVKTLVDEVEAASREQAQGIAQISKSVAQMDCVTQQTAANAEETAAASEELHAQSQAMLSVVARLQALVGA